MSKFWTEQETETLIKNIKNSNLTWQDVVNSFPNRTEKSIDHKIRSLKLTGFMSERKREAKGMGVKKMSVDEFVGSVLGKIKDTDISVLKPVRAKKIKQGGGDEEEVIQVLSDWQLGHKTISFNYKVAQERVQKLLKATVNIVNLHRKAYPLKKIHIFLLGDFVQSEKVGYLVDLSELESILIDQVYGHAIPLLADYIKEISKNFEQVNVYCVRGNHGRGEKGSSEKTNWDDVIYHTLKIKFSENDRINIRVAKEFYQIVDILGWKFLLAHGDQVRGGSYGIPLYALLQRMLRWATSMPFKWDFLVVGHWHNFAYLCQNNQYLLVNGTLVSDDEYVRKSYGWNASTSQVLCSVHKRKGLTWTYNLKLNQVFHKP